MAVWTAPFVIFSVTKLQVLAPLETLWWIWKTLKDQALQEPPPHKHQENLEKAEKLQRQECLLSKGLPPKHLHP